MKVYTSVPHPTILAAVKKIIEYVEPTYGAAGRGILVDETYQQQVLDDGYAVLEQLEFENELENAVLSYVKAASQKANKKAGDGTTTALIILGAIVFKVLEQTMGAIGRTNYNAIAAELRSAAQKAVDAIRKDAKKVSGGKDLEKIALNSYNHPELAKVIADMVVKVGTDGTITLEEGQTVETTADVVAGFKFDRGYTSPYFAGKDGETAEFRNPWILVTDQKMATAQELLAVVETMVQQGRKEFVIIADDVNGEALTTLVLNKLRGSVNCAVVKAPAFGDRRTALLEDIAILVGATFYTEKTGTGLSTFTPEGVGSAERVVITKDNTIIVKGAGKKKEVETRASVIRALTEKGAEFDKEFAKDRLAALTGGVGVIRVGAHTEVEMKAKKSKVEDAIAATRMAAKEGVIAGGGVTLMNLKTGSRLLDEALKEPRRVLEKNGLDAISEGAQDAAGVVIASIEAAVSVASTLITAGGIIAPKREKPRPVDVE